MTDSAKYQVPAIAIRVPDGASFISYGLCGHTTSITYDGFTFFSAPEIDYGKTGKVSADLSTQSFKIKNIPAESGNLFGDIYDRVQYGHVEAFIYELEVDIDTSAVVSARKIVKGLLYIASSRIDARILSLEIKEDKFYYDKIGGVICTEMCAVAYFGDKICKLPVTSVSGTVLSISRTVLTLTATPSGATLIYNNGYIEKDGLRVKIAHWESGAVFSMSEIPPDSWVGESVEVFIGCDKTLSSCRVPHNNESEFFGLGFSMVDYDALFEET